MMGPTSGKIDGDLASMQRQAKLSSDVSTNLQDSSKQVTSSVGDGLSVSSGQWALGLNGAEQDRHGVVTGQVAPKYQEASDGMHRGVGYYQDADDAATQEARRVSYGISGQI